MATNLTINGVVYPYPQTGDENWGDEATNWASAVSTGTLQQSAGNFVLSADVNFGSNFGVKAAYFKSSAATIATTGVLRLGNTDTVVWRNTANNADYSIAVNASNKFEWKAGATSLATLDGTGIFAPVISVVSPIFSSSSSNVSATQIVRFANAEGIGWRDSANGTDGTLIYDSQNQLTYTNNKVGTKAHFLCTNGVDGSGDHAVIEAATGGTAGTQYSSFLLRIGGGGGTTWSLFADSNASNLFSICNGTTPGTNAFLKIATTGAVAIQGTATNDSAAAGFYGEVVRAANATPVNFPTNGNYGDATNISLTAGDWDLSAVLNAQLNGATMTYFEIGISTTTGNSGTGLLGGDNYLEALPPTSAASNPATIAGYRVSITSTTTYYLKVRAGYSAGNPQYVYRISARRVR